jgi:HD domain
MERIDLERLKGWFSGYCRCFYTDNTENNRNFALKEKHTNLVCANMNILADSLTLHNNERLTAQAIALFHDVGRFEQYRRYSTFRDDMSVNHATLGVRVLAEERVLENIAEVERQTIFRAVTLHNVFRIPAEISDRDIIFIRMIRDADKLDIWRLFAEYYGLPEAERASAAGLGFPDLPEYPRDLLQRLQHREMLHLSTLKTLNDFKLLQLSWVFDLNFPVSFRLVLERGYIDRLAAALPTDGEVVKTLRIVRNFVEYNSAKEKSIHECEEKNK